MTDATPAPTPEQKPAAESKVSVIVSLAIGLLIFGGLVYAGLTRTDSGATGDGASTACKEYVRDNLRAPATAEFSRLQLTGRDRRWTVTGTVDAENLLGVPVRMEFRCTVDGAGDDWTLVSLTGLDG